MDNLCLVGMIAAAIAAWTSRSLLNAYAAALRARAETWLVLAERVRADLDRLALRVAEDAEGELPTARDPIELGHTLLGLRLVTELEAEAQRAFERELEEALALARTLSDEATAAEQRPVRFMLAAVVARLRGRWRRG